MGAVLLCAGAEGKRTALPHSRVMIHQPSAERKVWLQIWRLLLKEVLKIKDELYDIIAKHSKQPFEKLRRILIEIMDVFCGSERVRYD